MFYIFFFILNYSNNIFIQSYLYKKNNLNNINNKLISENINDDNYKKIITSKNILNQKETVMYKNILFDNVFIDNKYENYNIIKEEIDNKYLKKYKKRNIFLNEYKFLKNNKTKVYINIEQIFDGLNIYHIGVTFKSIFRKISYDIIGIRLYDSGFLRNKNRKKKYLFWDYSSKSIDEIIKYEKEMKYKYIIGIYDCRHYVRNLTSWACNNPTPIWRLNELMKN